MNDNEAKILNALLNDLVNTKHFCKLNVQVRTHPMIPNSGMDNAMKNLCSLNYIGKKERLEQVNHDYFTKAQRDTARAIYYSKLTSKQIREVLKNSGYVVVIP